MKTIKKILAPTDFSKTANNALQYAVELAKEVDAKLIVLHSYRVPAISDTAYPLGGMYPEGMVDIEDVKKEVSVEMDKIKEDYLFSKTLKFETVLQAGFAEENILEIIDNESIDLVVMGTRGANAIQELLGSTTSHIIESSKVPLLVIPEDVSFGQLTNIVLATDYQQVHKPEDYSMLLNMVDIFHAEVDVLHVSKGASKLNETELEVGEELDRILKKTRHKYHYDIEDENINEGIEKFLEKHSASMLAMIPRKHSFFDKLIHGSKTKHMIFHTHRPLLILKA
ncbi:nucleotide-binding universal stress UspA family protein [Catalinimonas alkaloidigena]|uniref:universal stress protein n=1 Tax=Catalinimonas alkaloidigena TaxID=1075417 RepID=UPI0024056962|nr:universal stress protein [Catalinimonas alkaloidigena]MDF9797498.1 nucleotide-binding universal stress UspA family protein [Catalinimonas alkaloidigena]